MVNVLKNSVDDKYKRVKKISKMIEKITVYLFVVGYDYFEYFFRQVKIHERFDSIVVDDLIKREFE